MTLSGFVARRGVYRRRFFGVGAGAGAEIGAELGGRGARLVGIWSTVRHLLVGNQDEKQHKSKEEQNAPSYPTRYPNRPLSCPSFLLLFYSPLTNRFGGGDSLGEEFRATSCL
jgi:hypothetical protein